MASILQVIIVGLPLNVLRTITRQQVILSGQALSLSFAHVNLDADICSEKSLLVEQEGRTENGCNGATGLR
jgi:hypothetical protein